MSGVPPIWQTQTDNARHFIQYQQAFPEIFPMLSRLTCPTRNSALLIGGHRASAPAIHANAPMAGRKRPTRRFSQRRASRASARVSIACAPSAGALQSERPAFAVGMVEQRMPRKPAPTSKPPAQALSRRKRTPQTETRADTPDTVELAKLTLQTICRDAQAPAAARAQAARTLLELAGALKNTAADTAKKTGPELTLAELDARLETLARESSALKDG